MNKRHSTYSTPKLPKRRWYMAVISLAVVGTILLLAQRWFVREPAYGGKPVSYWFDRLTSPGAEPSRTAIATIGAQAVPCLFDKVRADNGFLRRAYRTLGRHMPSCFERVIGKPQPPDRTLALRISWAVHPMGAAAIPALAAALQERSAAVRCAAVDVAVSLHDYPDETAPLLVNALKDGEVEVRMKVLSSLESDRSRATKAVLALVELLKDKVFDADGATIYLRERAAQLLGRIGSDADAAVPELKLMMSDPDPYTRQQAAIALWRITQDQDVIITVSGELEKTRDLDTYLKFLNVLATIGPAAHEALPVITRTMESWRGSSPRSAANLARAWTETTNAIMVRPAAGTSRR